MDGEKLIEGGVNMNLVLRKEGRKAMVACSVPSCAPPYYYCHALSRLSSPFLAIIKSHGHALLTQYILPPSVRSLHNSAASRKSLHMKD
jgi:hypothetical protein